MYVETFKIEIIVFIDNIIMCLTSHLQIIFHIRVTLLILTISLDKNQRKKFIQITYTF